MRGHKHKGSRARRRGRVTTGQGSSGTVEAVNQTQPFIVDCRSDYRILPMFSKLDDRQPCHLGVGLVRRSGAARVPYSRLVELLVRQNGLG